MSSVETGFGVFFYLCVLCGIFVLECEFMSETFFENLSNCLIGVDTDDCVDVVIYDNVKIVELSDGDFRVLIYDADGCIVANYDLSGWEDLKSRYSVSEESCVTDLVSAVYQHIRDIHVEYYRKIESGFPEWLRCSYDC